MTLFLPPTPHEWVLFLCIFIGLGFFIITAEFIRAALHGSPEITRKLVHIVTGALICFAPRMFVSGVPPMILAASFMVINFTAIRFGLLKGIHGTNRASFGTVYYPFAFFVLVLLAWDRAPFIITISMLVLALGDAAAAIVGENVRRPHLYYLTSDGKSLEGSAAMFLVTLGVTFAGLIVFAPGPLPLPPIAIACAVALVATAWEAISSQGTDNFTVPLSAGFVLDLLSTPLPHHNPPQFMLGLVLALAIATVSFRLKFLTASGAVATFLLASVIYGIGGWMWTVPMVTFFAASSMLSKIGSKKKLEAESLYDKSSRRDAGQVAANGGLAGAVIMIWYLFPEATIAAYAGYIGAIAAVTADTWGTEAGTLLSRAPRSIVTGNTVPPGTSGGVSMAGLAAGVAGALLIGLSAAAFLDGSLRTGPFVGSIIAAGFVGTLVDSLLGATVQARYCCGSCGKETERTVHCGDATTHAKGLTWITNDLVNWACAAAGCVAAVLLYL
jgi:uncharacterized protein (TIGR00297 family)